MQRLYLCDYLLEKCGRDVRVPSILKEERAVAIAEEAEIVIMGVLVDFFPIAFDESGD